MAEGAGVPAGEGDAVAAPPGCGVLVEGGGVSGVGLGVVLVLGGDVVRTGLSELAGRTVAGVTGVTPPVGVAGGLTST